jgi:hypothetical protein
MPVSNSRSATPESSAARKATEPSAQPGTTSPEADTANLSDTETLDNASSPELSALAVPPRLPPRTPKAGKPSTSSDQTFYTASWGSPYNHGSVPAGSHIVPSSNNLKRIPSAASVDDLEDSPGQFGLSHLIPSRLPPPLEAGPTRPSTPHQRSQSQTTPRLADFGKNFAQVASPARNLFSSLVKAWNGPSPQAPEEPTPARGTEREGY